MHRSRGKEKSIDDSVVVHRNHRKKIVSLPGLSRNEIHKKNETVFGDLLAGTYRGAVAKS